MKKLQSEERKILLRRFFYDDRRLYRLGKASELKWFDDFDYKFSKDDYAYFAMEEKKEAFEKLSNPLEVNDEKFVSALNEIGPPKYKGIDRFIGKYYYVDNKDGIFKLEDKQDDIRKEVFGALKDTKGRAYYFLKAIIDLYNEGKWDNAYGGSVWIDILAKIRDLKGVYPAPRDIAIIGSYWIYYKTGSRRYPTHTIPKEMIPIVDAELEKWKRNTNE